MKIPKFLKKGDTVGIVAPAGRIKDDAYVATGIKIFEKWGLKVVTGKYLYQEYNDFSGTDIQRAEDLQKMLDDPGIKAIACARGGYGTIRLLDKLDFKKFVNNPKWIIGFSDITVLHSLINNKYEIASIHAKMPVNFVEKDDDKDDSLLSLRYALFGKKLEYMVESFPLNITGTCTGVIAGGNLTTLTSLRGTPFDISPAGKILFLEDVGEHAYYIDRMMMNLKHGGLLENLEGLVVGQFTGTTDDRFTLNQAAFEIIHEKVKDYGYPVMFNFPAGHTSKNKALMLGSTIKLDVNKERAKIIF